MCRMNVVRSLCVLAVALSSLVMNNSTAVAGLFNRQASRYQYQRVTYTNNDHNDDSHHGHYGHDSGCHHDGPCHPNCCHHPVRWDANFLRYVRVIYFCGQFSAWFEADALVHPYGAVLGNSAIVLVPGVGCVRGWIVAVHAMPPMNSPYRASAETAPKNAAAPAGQPANLMNGRQQLESSFAQRTDASPAVQPVSTPTRSAVTGHVRVWTNKAGTRTAKAELLQIRENSVLVRDGAGQIFEQSFENLSDADVAFVRSGAAAPSRLATTQR